ncbi:head decoration protein [Chitinibacteraceae bacterium HSL-7]
MNPIQGSRTGEHVLSEAPGQLSRETIALAAGDALPAGQVLGQITASKQYAPYNPAASDGTETASAVLYARVAADTVPRPGVAHVRHAELAGDLLTGLDAAATTDFESRALIVR